MTDCVTLSFYRFPGLSGRFWALGQMGLARIGLARTPGLTFWKLCGSGTGEGFTPVLLPRVFAIVATWKDSATAHRQIGESAVFRRFARHAAEHWTVFLTPLSVRGQWSGVTPFAAGNAPASAPLAALTRATVRPRVAARFWRRVPDISDVIGRDPDVAFKIGIGEMPLLHQVTFSIWPDAAAMARFARHGPHAEAIRAVRDEGWFAEELYARFTVDDTVGSWEGQNPLARLEAA